MPDMSSVGAELAAYVLTAVMVAVLYLGLISVAHRATRAGWEHFVIVVFLVSTVPFVGIGAFAVIPGFLMPLIAPSQ